MSIHPPQADVECRNAQGLLEYLRPSHPAWGSEWDSRWVFRGHADASWELLAPVFRPDGRAKLRPIITEMAKRLAGWSYSEFEAILADSERLKQDEKSRNFIDHLISHAEHSAIERFAELSDELGLVVDVQEKWRTEPFAGPSLATALAQHHGVPTSLLDWTRNPLIATYFAACEESAAPHLAVWALDLQMAGIAARGVQVFQCPRSAHAFLHAQAGLFTWTQRDHRQNFLLSQGRWPSIPEVLSLSHDATTPPVLRRITLPRSEVGALRRLLWRERISRAHLMPTFDNVRAALVSRWRDEFETENGAHLPAPTIWVRPDGPNPLTDGPNR